MDRKNILLIEDEAAIAENVLYALKTEGFDPVWKSLGQDGLQALKQNCFDLLILDVGLPDVNGFELCKQIRTFSNLPIIFLSARNEEIDRVIGLEIGADDYVCKPFSPRELTARVKVILKRLQTPAGELVETEFVIDSNKNCIYFCNQALALTRYEYLILKTLLQKPEQVFSRERLMQLVWDEPEASFDRAVDTHIKSLRSKLKQVCAENRIITHRGFGYSIRADCHEI